MVSKKEKLDCMFLPSKHHLSRPVFEKLQSIGIYIFFGGDWLVQNCKGAKLYQKVIQQLRGPNFTQSRPPIPPSWVDNYGHVAYEIARCLLATIADSDPANVIFWKSRRFWWIFWLLFLSSHYVLRPIWIGIFYFCNWKNWTAAVFVRGCVNLLRTIPTK